MITWLSQNLKFSSICEHALSWTQMCKNSEKEGISLAFVFILFIHFFVLMNKVNFIWRLAPCLIILVLVYQMFDLEHEQNYFDLIFFFDYVVEWISLNRKYLIFDYNKAHFQSHLICFCFWLNMNKKNLI